MSRSLKKIEKKAIELVMHHEKSEGRNPDDLSTKKKGYDVKSGKRLIEVKGSLNRVGNVNIHWSAYKKVSKNIENYHIYLVDGVYKQQPKLRIIRPRDILENIESCTNRLIRGKKIKKLKLREIDL